MLNFDYFAPESARICINLIELVHVLDKPQKNKQTVLLHCIFDCLPLF